MSDATEVDWLHAELAGGGAYEVYPSFVDRDAGPPVAWCRACSHLHRADERLASPGLDAADTSGTPVAPVEPPITGFRPRGHALADGAYAALGVDTGPTIYLRVAAGRIRAWTASFDAARGWLGLSEPLADVTARLRAARIAELRAAHAALGLPPLVGLTAATEPGYDQVMLLGYEAREAALPSLRAFARWGARAAREQADAAWWWGRRERDPNDRARELLGRWAFRTPRGAGEYVGTAEADARFENVFEPRGYVNPADLTAGTECLGEASWLGALDLMLAVFGGVTRERVAEDAASAARMAFRDRLLERCRRSDGRVEARAVDPPTPTTIMGSIEDAPADVPVGTAFLDHASGVTYVRDEYAWQPVRSGDGAGEPVYADGGGSSSIGEAVARAQASGRANDEADAIDVPPGEYPLGDATDDDPFVGEDPLWRRLMGGGGGEEG